MTPVQALDFIRVLPEIVLASCAILVMVAEPFVSARHTAALAWVSLIGIAAAGAGNAWMRRFPGPAFGGSIAADPFASYFVYLLLFVAALTLLGSVRYLETNQVHHGEFYALLLLGTTGACLMVAATELIMIFIGLEISSISTYILAGFRRADKRSNEASLKYFLLGSFATAFLLYGIAFIYGLTGTTNLVQLSEKLSAPGAWPPLLWIALILAFVGLGFKVSIVPFHVWTPDVYQGAPAPVTAFLSVAPKAAAFAVILRVFLGALASAGALVFWLLWISALLTMCLGNLAALWQTNIKRMLAYSAIAHAGYVLVGMAAAKAAGPEAGEGMASVLFYLAAYALMNVAAFILVAHLAGAGERYQESDDYTGLASQRPGVAACLTLLLVSLSGFPATAGFFAKFYVFRAAIHAHLIGLTLVAVLNSVVAVYYYLRVVVAMYMREGNPRASASPLPWPLGAALALSLVGIFYLGLFPTPFVRLANLAASPLP